MTLHVLGHLLELPALALPDWRRGGPRGARLAGSGLRGIALGTRSSPGWRSPALDRFGRGAMALREFSCLI